MKNNFKDINELCVDCVNKCKQFKNVKIIRCPIRKVVKNDSKKVNKIKGF